MQRRQFLLSSVALAAGAMHPAGRVRAAIALSPDHGWRSFEVTHRVEILQPKGATRVWLPLPSVREPGWIRNLGDAWQGNAAAVRLLRDQAYGARMLRAEWAPGERPVLEVTSRFATRDRVVDLDRPADVAPLPDAARQLYSRPTTLLPTDGIVRDTARTITRGAKTDEAKAHAIYGWIVENTFRNPETRGCGRGDIRFMLETGDLSGKCADLNALYVGLARAAGLPARDVYGIRVADSRFGYKSLGKSGDVSKAQHCRAEVWLERFGWVPVDPADVRKVVLEESPGKLALDDPKVLAARRTLFGAWEMNWLGYNFAHDLPLPGSDGRVVPFLMYPQGESGGRPFDSLDPAAFRYTLTATEIATA